MELDVMKQLREPAQNSRSHLDFEHRSHPHREELPDREVVRIRSEGIEDDNGAYENLKSEFLLQLHLTSYRPRPTRTARGKTMKRTAGLSRGASSGKGHTKAPPFRRYRILQAVRIGILDAHPTI